MNTTPADVVLSTVRGARVAVLAALLPAAAFLVLNTSTDVLGNTRADVALLPLALVVVGLQLALSIATLRGRRPAHGRLAWLAIVACVAALISAVGPADLPGLWFVAAAGAMVFSPRVGLGVLVASIVVFFVLAISASETLPQFLAVFAVYSLVTGAAGAAGPFMAARLLGVVQDLARTRAELELTATDEERRRLSRDLHDTLGQGLSAVALKGDLALALLKTDPVAARRELHSLTAEAQRLRSELPHIVAEGQAASYAVEANRAERLLREAGIDVRRSGDPGPLTGAVDSALGWVVREAATNVLRHSDARHWTIEAGRDDAAVWIEATNDRPRPAPDCVGSGLTGMAERLHAVAGRLHTGDGRDRFTLRVEVGT